MTTRSRKDEGFLELYKVSTIVKIFLNCQVRFECLLQGFAGNGLIVALKDQTTVMKFWRPTIFPVFFFVSSGYSEPNCMTMLGKALVKISIGPRVLSSG
jgi:hypothetical protein